MLPLTERDPNLSGRNSRASAVSSIKTRSSSKHDATAKADPFTTAPGVMSMLRTTTELGDVASLAIPSHNHRYGQSFQRKGYATSRTSAGSNNSGQTYPRSGHHAWPSTSTAPRQSGRANLTVPDQAFNGSHGFHDPHMAIPPPLYLPNGGRSLSLTREIRTAPPVLANQRSATSLRANDPMPRPRSPYIYPARLKRPGIRSPSPTLSDITGMNARKLPSVTRSGAHAPRMQYNTQGPRTREALHVPPYSQAWNMSAPENIGRPGSRSGHQTSEHGQTRQLPILAPAPLRIRRPTFPAAPPAPVVTGVAFDSPDNTASSMQVMVSPVAPRAAAAVTREFAVSNNADGGPVYYDYSEAFHIPPAVVPNLLAPQSPPVPNGFVHRIKALLQERVTVGAAAFAEPALYTPVGIVPELSGEHSIVELPAEDSTIEAIAQLITDAREHNDLDRASEEGNVTADTAGGVSDAGNDHSLRKNKRLSAISEAPSGVTNSTSNVELSIRYSVAFSVPTSSSRPRITECTEEEPTAPDSENNQSFTKHKSSQDLEHSTTSTGDVNSTDASTGEIRIATEVVFEQKQEALSILQPHTSNIRRPKSESVLSSSPEYSSSRYSAPTQGGAWSSTEKNVTSTVTSPTDVAVALSVPSLVTSDVLAASPASDVIPSPSEQQNCEPAAEVPHTIVLNVTEPTETSKTILPVSPLDENALPSRRDSPVSPLGRQTLKKPSPLARKSGHSLVGSRPSSQADKALNDRASLRNSQNAPPSAPAETISMPKKPVSQDMSTTDLRFSTLRHTAGPAFGLPDLKGEPEEEDSVTDLRISSFKFPAPGRGRRASFDSATGRMSRDSARTGRTSLPVPPPVQGKSKALEEMRAIPSLNFSHINLIDRLNQALGHRATRSVDESTAAASGLSRPATAEIRERYKSFFAGLDMLDSEASREARAKPASENAADKAFNSSEGDQEKVVTAIQRPMRPQEIIKEVNSLAIPRVEGLTQRLSEFVPALKSYCSNGEDITERDTVELTIAQIRALGRRRVIRADGKVISLVKDDDCFLSDEQVPETLNDRPDNAEDATNSKRASAATEATVDDVGSAVKAEEKGTTATIESTTSEEPKGNESAQQEVRQPLVAELEAPAPAVVRGRSLTDSFGVVRSSSNLLFGLPDPRRSLAAAEPRNLSSSSLRPWNIDASYPWATDDIAIDISFPALSHRRDSPRAGPSKLRARLSNEVGADHAPKDGKVQKTPNADPEDHTGSTDDTFASQRRRSLRRSVIGSAKRKIGNTLSSHGKRSALGGEAAFRNSATTRSISPPSPPPPTASGFDTAGWPLGPELLSLREPLRAVDPGDRYPTTGLSPPNTFNLDDVRSFFSDDSSVAGVRGSDATQPVHHRFGFGKRLTGLGLGLGVGAGVGRLKLGVMGRTASAMDHHQHHHGEAIADDDNIDDLANGNIDGGHSAAGVTHPDRAKAKYRLHPTDAARQPHHYHLRSRGDAPSPGASSATRYDGLGTPGSGGSSDVQGMSKAEFRARRLVEHLRALWCKGGELIRSFSGKARLASDEDETRWDGAVVAPQRKLGAEQLTVYSGT